MLKDYIQRTEERFDKRYIGGTFKIEGPDEKLPLRDDIKSFLHTTLTGLVEEIKGEVEGKKNNTDYSTDRRDDVLVIRKNAHNAALDSVLSLLSSITSNDESLTNK